MKRLITKSDRLAVRTAQFEHMLNNGFTMTEYKEGVYTFFTKDETTPGQRAKFLLKVYAGTAANPKEYTNYGSDARRSEIIQNYKSNHESHMAWKATQKNNKSNEANAAAQMKAELQKAFPGVKFSVRSDSFSGGDAVRVSWVDGPTSKQVDDITDKYQYGHFNGMEDIYEYSNKRTDIAQTKYVTTSRTISAEVKQTLLADAEHFMTNGWEFSGCHDADNFAYRVAQANEIPVGAIVLGIERTEHTSGTGGDVARFFCIKFDPSSIKPINPVPSKGAAKVEEVEVSEAPVPTGTAIMVVNRDNEGIQIVDYSEKALAIFGDTRAMKDMLSDMGGKWNRNLKHNGETKAGWIFSKKRAEQIKNLLGR